MLGKLLKYDLRATAGTMLISYVILLGYALILQLTGLDLNFSNPYLDFQWIMRLFLYVGFVIVMVGVLLFTYVQILRRFYNNLFSAQGYLTNTLPVRPEAILVSKVLMGVIWIAVTYLILVGCTAMLGTDLPAIARSVLFSNLRLALENTPTVYFVLTGILLVLSPFASVLTFFACICLGQLFFQAAGVCGGADLPGLGPGGGRAHLGGHQHCLFRPGDHCPGNMGAGIFHCLLCGGDCGVFPALPDGAAEVFEFGVGERTEKLEMDKKRTS